MFNHRCAVGFGFTQSTPPLYQPKGEQLHQELQVTVQVYVFALFLTRPIEHTVT